MAHASDTPPEAGSAAGASSRPTLRIAGGGSAGVQPAIGKSEQGSAGHINRIEPLATLPVFFELSGKRVAMAGGGAGAAWKAELLAAAGADVLLYCPAEEIGEDMAALIASKRAEGRMGGSAAGSLTHRDRPWATDSFAHCALAVGDCEGAAEGQAFACAARAAGVPVNVVDKPAFCDFRFGTIVNRSPAIVAVSTDGAAPILGQAIRRRIETLLPPALKSWAGLAASIRAEVLDRLAPGPGRRAFWERFSDRAFTERAPDAGDEAGLRRLIEELARAPTGRPAIAQAGVAGSEAAASGPGASGPGASGSGDGGSGDGGFGAGPVPASLPLTSPILPEASGGRVTLVGAGPGEAELLTLKAVRALQAADVILFDDLVSAEILELARREAKRMLVGKRAARESCRQEDINRMMIAFAKAGKHVVRLKSGDVAVFGRAGEEIAALAAEGIPVAIVPGITAASAMAASFGVSLTHRDRASQVRFVTGHSKKGGLPADLDWAALSDDQATTIFYMGGRMAPEIAAMLIANGLSPKTPVAVASNISRSDETKAKGTLDRLGAIVDSIGIDRPILIGVGRVFEERAGETGEDGAAGPAFAEAAEFVAAPVIRSKIA